VAAVISSGHYYLVMRILRINYFAGLLLIGTFYLSRAQEGLIELYNSDHFESVIHHGSEAIAAGDTGFNTFYLKALSEVQIGQIQEAIHTLESAELFFPEDDRIISMMARQYYDIGAYIQARELYNQFVKNDSTDVASLLKLAEIASFTQQYSEAVSILEHILILDTTNLNSLILLGDILTRQNNSGALIYYKRAWGLYPNNQKVAYALGNWYIQAKMPARAIPICESILKNDSTNIKFQKLMGFAYYKMGDPLPGIVHFQKAVELGDSSLFTFKFMGISQYLTVNFNNAIESLQVAVEKDTLDAENHFFLGASLGTTLQKETAMYHLNKSLALMQPDPAVTSRIYSEQGNIMRLEMEYEKAYERYSLAWETDTTNLMALYLMASILDNSMHRSKEALVDYQKFIDQVDRLPVSERSNSQIPSIKAIVEDRIVSLKEELFFLDEQ